MKIGALVIIARSAFTKKVVGALLIPINVNITSVNGGNSGGSGLRKEKKMKVSFDKKEDVTQFVPECDMDIWRLATVFHKLNVGGKIL